MKYNSERKKKKSPLPTPIPSYGIKKTVKSKLGDFFAHKLRQRLKPPKWPSIPLRRFSIQERFFFPPFG